MKKILLVTTSDRMAGAEKSIFDLLRLADKNKYDFMLVVFKHEKNGELVKKVSELGIKVESLNMNSKWQFFKLVKLWNILKSFKPDILESFLFFDNQICRIFGKLLGVKYIISGQRNVETKRGFFRNLIEKLTINFVYIVISNTEAGKDFYVRNNYLPESKVLVIRNGLDIDRLKFLQSNINDKEIENIFNLSLFKNIPKIIMVGYLKEQKGVLYLIQAVKILKEKGIMLECYIVGQGYLENNLKNEVALAKVDDRVHFVGYLDGAYKYFKFFDLFVLPSVWEGLPNVILEAMASKLPVISTSVGGVPEIIKDGENGFLVEPQSPELIADKIEFFLSLEKVKIDKIKESAYKTVKENFSIESMVKGYETCYDKYFN